MGRTAGPWVSGTSRGPTDGPGVRFDRRLDPRSTMRWTMGCTIGPWVGPPVHQGSDRPVDHGGEPQEGLETSNSIARMAIWTAQCDERLQPAISAQVSPISDERREARLRVP